MFVVLVVDGLVELIIKDGVHVTCGPDSVSVTSG